MSKGFLLGSSKEHFKIEDNTIIGLSQNLKDKFKTGKYTYSGPLKICFPGCENITEIGKQALCTLYLHNVSSVDLSCMTGLEKICLNAFHQIGFDNKDFSEINLLCPNLKEISHNAFSQAGYESTTNVKLIFNCPNLEIIQDFAFSNIRQSRQKGKKDKYYLLDLSNCPKLWDIKRCSFNGCLSHINVDQVEIKLPPNIRYIRQHAFGKINALNKIIIDISNKQYLYIIDQECFQAPIKYHIIIKNCPELTIIKRQDSVYREFLIHLDIDFGSCPKLQQIFEYDAIIYNYYQSLGKQHLLQTINHLDMDTIDINNTTKHSRHHLLWLLKRQQIDQQLQLKDVKHKQQQICPTIDNLENTLDQLQQQVRLQKQIIKQQHEQYMFLERQLELYNQRFGTEDDQ